MPVRLDKVIAELAVVNAKLEAQPTPSTPRRMELLRRQATLGDVRDAILDAARRRQLDDR